MKLGVLTVVLYDRKLEEALEFLNKHGVTMVELGVGGFPGKTHVDAGELLDNPEKIDALKALLNKYQMGISALSCHGNPVHPNKEIADSFHNDFLDAVVLAGKLGVDTVVTFSGCPGSSENDIYPNWVTCQWPEDFSKIVKWQWEEKLVPYWKKAAEFAKEHGVTKIALELHPGFCVYNPSSLLKLREAVGDIIGANFDPSHLFWQGIDPVAAIKELKGAIHHFHAKDTKMDWRNCQVNGVLDLNSFTNAADRSWLFRTVGYGNGYDIWKAIISALKVTGYDGTISIEHEDALMSPTEGLIKAIDFLKQVIIFEKAGEIWWA